MAFTHIEFNRYYTLTYKEGTETFKSKAEAVTRAIELEEKGFKVQLKEEVEDKSYTIWN